MNLLFWCFIWNRYWNFFAARNHKRYDNKRTEDILYHFV